MDSLDGSPSLRFGSSDSQDVDVAYLVDSLPSVEQCKALCRGRAGGSETPLPEARRAQGEEVGRSDGSERQTENRNMIIVRDGVVVDCFKGAPDEMNNAILATFHLHQQKIQSPIRHKLPRLVPLKVVRSVRTILSQLTKGPQRIEIKAALGSYNQEERVNALRSVDFCKVELDIEARKSLAFQLGQVLGLLAGRELYTKSEIREYLPVLAPFLARQTDSDAAALNVIRDQLVTALREVYLRTKGSLNLFCYINSAKVDAWNIYEMQSRGTIIDLKTERCVVYPYEKFFKLDELDGWRLEDLPPEGPDEIVEKVDGSFVSAFMNGGELEFACKGNFDVEQSLRAKVISAKYNLSALDFERYFYTFEVVYPENRFPKGFASVDYGEEALFLTGMREKSTFRLMPYSDVIEHAQRAGLRYPERFECSFPELLAKREDGGIWRNFEGWVANFAGKRVKVKVNAYMRVNDILNGLKHGNRRVLKKYLSLSPEEWAEYIAPLPEEFMFAVDEELSEFQAKRDELVGLLRDAATQCGFAGEGSPEFIQAAQERIHQRYHRVLFRLVRGHVDEAKIKRVMLDRIFSNHTKNAAIDWEIFV